MSLGVTTSDDYDTLSTSEVRVAADRLFKVDSVEVLTVLNAALTFDDSSDVSVFVEFDSVDAAVSSSDVFVNQVTTGRKVLLETLLSDLGDSSHEVALTVVLEVSSFEGDAGLLRFFTVVVSLVYDSTEGISKLGFGLRNFNDDSFKFNFFYIIQ